MDPGGPGREPQSPPPDGGNCDERSGRPEIAATNAPDSGRPETAATTATSPPGGGRPGAAATAATSAPWGGHARLHGGGTADRVTTADQAAAANPAGAAGVSATAPGALGLVPWTSYTVADVMDLMAWMKQRTNNDMDKQRRNVLNNHTTNRSRSTRTIEGEDIGGPIITSFASCCDERQLSPSIF